MTSCLYHDAEGVVECVPLRPPQCNDMITAACSACKTLKYLLDGYTGVHLPGAGDRRLDNDVQCG